MGGNGVEVLKKLHDDNDDDDDDDDGELEEEDEEEEERINSKESFSSKVTTEIKNGLDERNTETKDRFSSSRENKKMNTEVLSAMNQIASHTESKKIEEILPMLRQRFLAPKIA